MRRLIGAAAAALALFVLAAGAGAQTLAGWVTDDARTGIICMYTTTHQMEIGNGTFGSGFTPLVDPVTNLSWTGNLAGGYSWGSGPPGGQLALSQGSVDAAKHFGSQASFIMPGFTATSNGYCTYYINYSGSDATWNYGINMWVRNGVATLDPPQGTAPGVPVASSHGQYDQTTANLNIHVQSSVNSLAIGKLYVTYQGPSVGSSQLSTGGNWAVNNIYPGSYVIRVVGNMRTSTGGYTKVDQSVNATVAANSTAKVTILLNDNGTLGNTQGGDGSSSGSGGMIIDALKYLFVPHQAAIDQMKTDMSGFFNWGPFALIGQFSALTSAPTSTLAPVQIPMVGYNTTTRKWQSNGVNLTVPVFSAATGAGWAAFRALMGAGVWLSFGALLIHHFMPRQTM